MIINYAFSSTVKEDRRRCSIVIGGDRLTGWHPLDEVLPSWRVVPRTLYEASLARRKE